MRRALLFIAACIALAAATELASLISRVTDEPAGLNTRPPNAKLIKNEFNLNSDASKQPTLVGRDACRECHKENYRLHANSGHASTFSSTRDSKFIDKFNRNNVDTGEPYGVFSYFADSQGLYTKRHSDPLSKTFRLQFALGSGHNGVTLFSLVPDAADGTVGIEHRVSWFAHHDNLGLTPAQHDKTPASENELYGVKLRGKQMRDCVGCHTTAGTIVAQEVVGLVPNVNCEKCHGPGSDHVRQARRTASPPPYSVGRGDWDAESEIQLCGSCHRMPIDVSIKDLREYENSIVRFQPIGLLRSECYLESEGQLSCTTCHNPHQSVHAKPKAAFVDDCIRCHQESSPQHLSCPVSPTNDCIECHMPKIEFEQGMTFHDHWIRVPKAK